MTEQDIKDWFAANPGVTDTQMTQAARLRNVDPGMIARATGVPVTDVYARMAAVPQQQQSPWTPQEVQVVRDWVAANPNATPDQIYSTAQNLGLSADQLSSLWSQATGANQGDVSREISSYAQGTGRNLSGGYVPQINRQQQQLPSYNTFLDNLMSSMSASGGMMGGNMGFDMPALATSTYVRPTFGNLNDVRTQAEAAYKAKKAAEEEAAKQAEIKQAIEQYVSSGGDLGMLTGNGYNGFGPSGTSYTGYSDALAAKGQTSGVSVESMGTSAGYDGSAIGGGYSDGSDGGYW